jgi:hypothetical protein
MVDREAALGHQFLQVPQTQTEAQERPHACDNHLTLELAFPEQRRSAGLHCITVPDPQLQHIPFLHPARASAFNCMSAFWSFHFPNGEVVTTSRYPSTFCSGRL